MISSLDDTQSLHSNIVKCSACYVYDVLGLKRETVVSLSDWLGLELISPFSGFLCMGDKVLYYQYALQFSKGFQCSTLTHERVLLVVSRPWGKT